MPSLTRRTAMLTSLAAIAASTAHAQANPSDLRKDGFGADIQALEAKAGGRLGLAMISLGGEPRGHRLNERFALCSTYKLPLAAMVLWAADQGQIALSERLPFSKQELLGNSPVTQARVSEGALSIEDLARAAQVTSDNTAAELLLRRMGGPSMLNAWLAKLGDSTTRLDHYLDHLNMGDPDRLEDTTTPQAMARTVLALMTGDTLRPASRAKLLAWMQATTTGKKRLRAGLPSNWAMGHKTGTGIKAGSDNQINDIAIAFPPSRPPLAIAVYYQAPGHFETQRPEDEAVLAKAGTIAARWV